MNHFNICVFEGNLVRDPKLTYVRDGQAVCRFTVASSRNYKKKNGEEFEEVCFLDVATWRKLGEACSKYLKKGSRVLVSGTLKKETFLDQKGGQRQAIYIDGQRVNFLPGRADY